MRTLLITMAYEWVDQMVGDIDSGGPILMPTAARIVVRQVNATMDGLFRGVLGEAFE